MRSMLSTHESHAILGFRVNRLLAPLALCTLTYYLKELAVGRQPDLAPHNVIPEAMQGPVCSHSFQTCTIPSQAHYTYRGSRSFPES